MTLGNPHLIPGSYAERTWGAEDSKYHALYVKLNQLLNSKRCRLSVERMEAAIYLLEKYESLINENIKLTSVPTCGLYTMMKRISRLCKALECESYEEAHNKLQEMLKT